MRVECGSLAERPQTPREKKIQRYFISSLTCEIRRKYKSFFLYRQKTKPYCRRYRGLQQSSNTTTMTNPVPKPPLQANDTAHPLAMPQFTADPSLTAFQVPSAEYIANLPNTPDYALIATGAYVFTLSNRTPYPFPQQTNPSPQPGSSNNSTDGEPRLLLLQRAAHDSLPLLWEPAGGATDDTDTSILHSSARELFEETSLRAAHFVAVVEPAGRVFQTSSGKKVCKFEFVVEVVTPHDRDAEANGISKTASMPRVKLDPEEHEDHVWATEKECLDGWTRTEDGKVIQLKFTFEEQKQAIMKAFHIFRETTAS
jgi:8-oxo-dGTP pyrophosphatase MutT (NUDIX family)